MNICMLLHLVRFLQPRIKNMTAVDWNVGPSGKSWGTKVRVPLDIILYVGYIYCLITPSWLRPFSWALQLALSDWNFCSFLGFPTLRPTRSVSSTKPCRSNHYNNTMRRIQFTKSSLCNFCPAVGRINTMRINFLNTQCLHFFRPFLLSWRSSWDICPLRHTNNCTVICSWHLSFQQTKETDSTHLNTSASASI